MSSIALREQNVRWFTVLGAAMCLAGLAATADTLVVQDGQAKGTIVIPRNAGSTVQLAAAELARYIEMMSGAEVPIAQEGGRAPAGVPIHVGRTQVGRAALPGELAKQAESVVCRADGERVIICGGSERGTLFAVYRFLEEALGCRWLAPDVEFVPEQSTWDQCASDAEYHCLGSGRGFVRFGKALAEAMLKVQERWLVPLSKEGRPKC